MQQTKKKKYKEPAYSSETSRVKLLIYLKNGEKETFYSFFNDDKKEFPQIIRAMHRRLLQGTLKGTFNVALFYDNTTGNEIVRYDYAGRKILP